MIMLSGCSNSVSIFVTIGKIMRSSATDIGILGNGLSFTYCLAICMMAVRICKLTLTTSMKISIETFSFRVGLISLKKSSNWTYSYCVPCVEIRYIRMSVLVSDFSSRLFIDVLATSI